MLRFFFTLFLLMTARLFATEPYHATISVPPVSASVASPNIHDLTMDLRAASLESIVPFYTPVSPLAVRINLRGIDVISSFAAGSTVLVVNIPQAGITQTFAGATRDDSFLLFKESIQNGGAGQKLLRAYARYSPIDPIAGNPNSLMAQMAQSDYLLGNLSPFSGCDPCWSSQPITHQFQAGTFATRAFSGGFDTTSVTLPLRYSYSPTGTWAFIFDMPLTYNRNGGASSVYTSTGTAFRLPITERWSLTSSARLGVGGSLDLCTSAGFFSAGVTSAYNYKLNNYILGLTNYAGYFTSINLWLDGINFNYHLHNYVFKNGISITSCNGFSFLNREINFNLYFEDSYFAKDRLYIRHFDEVGAFLITTHVNPCLDYDCLSLGFICQFGEKNYKGYTLKCIYQF